jgi:hypothetical protein
MWSAVPADVGIFAAVPAQRLLRRAARRRLCITTGVALPAAYRSGRLLGRRRPELGSELEPSRFAPLMLTQAVSPAAKSPSMGVAPLMSVCTPPIM